MNAPQLPAYLQNKQSRGLAQTLVGNLGVSSPPFLSIMGNRLSLIDAAGEEIPVETFDPKLGQYIDCAVIDALEHTSKIYYDKPFDPNASQYEPPACFSDNGIAASRNASKPQSATCASCPQAAWGSKVSAVSHKGIKACADIQKIALLVPGFEMPFLLRVPPGSRTNFRGYVNKFVGQPIDVCDVITRIYFRQGVNGILCFDAVGYIDEASFGQREKLAAAHATDSMIGRTDMPIQGALAAPAAAPAIEHQPQPFMPSPMTQTAPLAAPAPQQPTLQAQPGGRRRRNTAEAAPQGQPQAAPFMPQAPAPQPNGPLPSFGMANAPAPNVEISATLEGLFGKK